MIDRKIFLSALGTILILAGTVFFLQGVNVLPGSFMTGQREWAFYGGIFILTGILLINSNRKRD
jgi:hypothetical protein